MTYLPGTVSYSDTEYSMHIQIRLFGRTGDTTQYCSTEYSLAGVGDKLLHLQLTAVN